MFDYIKIEGFRSFKKVELNLAPLSVLIGPNGGGKSNFMDLLMLLADAGNGQLAIGINKRGGFRNIAFGFNSSQEVRVDVRFRGLLDLGSQGLHLPLLESSERRTLDVSYAMGLLGQGANFRIGQEQLRVDAPHGQMSLMFVNRDATGTVFRLGTGPDTPDEERKSVTDIELAISQVRDANKYPVPYGILQQFQKWTFYRDMDVGPQSALRQPSLIRAGIQLYDDGSNLASVFYAIQQGHPDDWEEISEILRTANPNFGRLTVPAEGGDGKVLLRWFERPFNHGQSANLLSDGTLKLLCLVAILKNPSPPPLICIDEPEVGLHPDWIELVAELMQSAAARTQLIVATHSPQIVAKLDPEQVVVTEKHDGETRLTRLNGHELEKWLNEFNLSDLWLAGHLGGRP